MIIRSYGLQATTSVTSVPSEGHIAELSRIFDTPHGQPFITAPTAPQSSAIDTMGSMVQLSTAPVLRSESGAYEQQQHEEEQNREAQYESASRIEPRVDLDDMGEDGTSQLSHSACPASSRSSLPPQQPGETHEQYDARYEANIRRVNHTQAAWARPYNPKTRGGVIPERRGSPQVPAMPYPTSRDTRFEEPLIVRGVDRPPASPNFELILRPPNPYAGVAAPPIGLSAYQVTQGPVTNGLWDNNHYHYVVLLGRVSQLINFKVGEPFEVPTGFKQPKLHEPSKYAGSHSHDDFMDWLSEFLNWLRGHYICGPATDPIRIVYLGLSITGSASDWFLTEIDNPSRSYDPPLKFTDCVCLMHKRFVCTAMANDAAIKYNGVRYASTDGVEGLYYKLDRAAEHMVERPNTYDFRRQLFNSLPRWLQDKLMDRNIVPEYVSLEDIRENARQIEENTLRVYEGLSDAAPAAHAGTTRATQARSICNINTSPY
ncbi:hypothetical protein HWV62_29118 [Athelia sp. TMB]|nr:hypothetical protein HWV62_29118 [Athelia sp. TMB]